MPKNRLKLDFSLSTDTERINFVNNYLKDFDNPTDDELETIANYVLWGRTSSGKNVVQEKLIQIQTRAATWDTQTPDSLEEMLESPTFSEAKFNAVPTKKQRVVFSRSECRAHCPASLLPHFEELWRRIDDLELTINYYDLRTGKRKNPPRPQLLARFTPEEQLHLQQVSETWNQFKYLKNRHLLVELRREQFTMRDSFAQPMSHGGAITPPIEQEDFDFRQDVTILPLGLKADNPLLFKEKSLLNPTSYNEKELEKVSKIYWMFKDMAPSPYTIDFCDIKDTTSLLIKLTEVKDDAKSLDELGAGSAEALLQTLYYYIDFADLNEIQRDLLQLKLNKKTNQEISSYLNKKYDKSYTPNYISTIFRQRIIPLICAGAEIHRDTVGSLFFPEEFKKCSCCGSILPLNTNNFMRRSRSRDGFSNKCKKCDAAARKSAKS